MPESLKEIFCKPHEQQQKKHDFVETYVESHIDNLTNYEFLTELSWALDQYMAQFKQSN